MAERRRTTGIVTPEESHGVDLVVATTHEIGSVPEDMSLERVVSVPPSTSITHVLFRSEVRATGARALRSPAYLAAVRRREAQTLLKLLDKLGNQTDSPDFVVWTHEPLERLRRLIRTLSESEEFSYPRHEGNSTEILRQLRDSFLKSGWKRYREPEVREVARIALVKLADVDEVSADDAYRVGDQLLNLGIDPAVGDLCGDAEGDGQEKAEILD